MAKTKKNILFRVDSGKIIGAGHLSRCLSILPYLPPFSRPTFISKDLPGRYSFMTTGIPEILLEPGKKSLKLEDHATWFGESWKKDVSKVLEGKGETKYDLLVVDHYALTLEWEEEMLKHFPKILVYDDYPRIHAEGVYVWNANYSTLPKEYEVMDPTRVFLGPEYFPLNPLYYSPREIPWGEESQIFVFFGGADPAGLTYQTCLALASWTQEKKIKSVILSNSSQPNFEKIQALCEPHPYLVLKTNLPNLKEEYEKAWVCIGAGGISSLERFTRGLPSLVYSFVKGHNVIMGQFMDKGMFRFLGEAVDFDPSALLLELDALLSLSREERTLLAQHIQKHFCPSKEKIEEFLAELLV
mgnify:CR=1 FL=1